MGRGVGQQRQHNATTPVPGVDFVATLLRGKPLCAAALCARQVCGSCQGVKSINTQNLIFGLRLMHRPNVSAGFPVLFVLEMKAIDPSHECFLQPQCQDLKFFEKM